MQQFKLLFVIGIIQSSHYSHLTSLTKEITVKWVWRNHSYSCSKWECWNCEGLKQVKQIK